MTLPARAACLAIRLYQVTLSWLLGGCCRFLPSCSNYALEAVRRHGFLAGSWLAGWRILRCNPFCRGGFDPVPETFRMADVFSRRRAETETETERA